MLTNPSLRRGGDTETHKTQSKTPSTLFGPYGTRQDQVYDALKCAILSVEFLPGALIRTNDICEWFDLSRSTVTEAYNRLSQDGLIEFTHKAGMRVSRLSMSVIREDVFLREALEVAAAHHAARHCTEAALARLHRNIEMQKLLIMELDKDDYLKADAAFHRIVLETTEVSRLPSVVKRVSTHLDRARPLLLANRAETLPQTLSETLAEHVNIFKAIRYKESEAAQKAMRYHLRQLIRRIEPMETAHPDMFSA